MIKYLKRFKSINENDFYNDFHIHSTCSDGTNSIKDIMEYSYNKNLSVISITDHVRKDSTYFENYLLEIKRNANCSISVLPGFEAKIKSFNGDLDVDDNLFNETTIQIGSVHRFPLGRKLYKPDSFDMKISQEIELELSIAAIRRRTMNIIGHPGGMSIKTFNDFPLMFFREIIKECINNDVAFELNSAYHAKIYNELKPILEEFNPYVSFGSDAHSLKDIGKWLDIINNENRDIQ